MTENLVYLKCFQVGNKLRVRITSPGYHNNANCQFPRAIRAPNRCYTVPPFAISFARGSAGKFFYRIKKNAITVLNEPDIPTLDNVTIAQVYEAEDTECIVCMEALHDVVLVPCGHYCLCKGCAGKIQQTSGKCPLCRCCINFFVTRDQVALAS